MCQDSGTAPDTAATKTDVGAALNRAYSAADADKALRTKIGDTLNPYLSNLLTRSKSTADQQTGLAGNLADNSKSLTDSFGAYSPVMKQAASDALNYGTTNDQEAEAGKAAQTADEQTSAAADAAARSLSDMGVNPNSGRFAGTQIATRLAGAQAAASAANKARETTRLQGIGLRQQAVSTGLGINSAATQTAGAASQVGSNATTTESAAVNPTLATGQFLTGAAGNELNAAQLGVNANLGLGGQANSAYATKAGAASQNNAGVGSLVGVIGGKVIDGFGADASKWLKGQVGGTSPSSGIDTSQLPTMNETPKFDTGPSIDFKPDPGIEAPQIDTSALPTVDTSSLDLSGLV